MIDFGLLRRDPALIAEICKRRKMEIDVYKLLEIDTDLQKNKARLEELQHQRKLLSKDTTNLLKGEIKSLRETTTRLEAEKNEMWRQLPNILADDVPDGENDTYNVELRNWGQIPVFDFKPQTHETIGVNLGILDLARGSKVAGAGFYYWVGDGAILAMAIFQLAQQILLNQGFTLMLTPVVAKKETLFGTGYLPFSKDQFYEISDTDTSLIGTSEQTLVSFHMNEILDKAVLPLKYCALTPCFRTEAGSYGKATKGAFRVHQFHKTEQIIICHPNDSPKFHDICLANEEHIMQMLKVPYRVMNVCVGDMGAPGYKKYDIEAWFSGYEGYRETHSNTNLLDFQARRLKIRVKSEKNFFPHTISATMITDRVLLAILENNQTADGSVIIPEALRPFINGKEVIKKK
jgi:seryl-tRNA synthetase